jgi:regulator of replication initiation timing
VDSRTEKRVTEAHSAIDALVEALRLDAEQHDFRIASLVHEVQGLRTENETLKRQIDALNYQIELLQGADAAKKAEKAAKKAAKAQAQAQAQDVDAP